MARWMKYKPNEILTRQGPLLSRELAAIMSKKHQVSIDAARKGVERAYKSNRIIRIEFMTFGRREHLYYSSKTAKQLIAKKALEAIKYRRPIIYRLWKALQREKILSHRDGLKITGLPTKPVGKKETYKDVIDYLAKLGLAYSERVVLRSSNIGFLILNSPTPISEGTLRSYAEQLVSAEQSARSYLWRAESMHMVKKVKFHTQVGNRIFDAVGEAVSRRYMVVVFDFILSRTTQDYDIEGLLDRVFSAYRKKFKQVVITYCISKKFTKAAQQKAMTGRFRQINLIRVEMKNGRMVTRKIDGISRQSRGEFLENQIRYILRTSGFEDVQKGLKIYREKNGLTEKPTSETFTDIDIIARSKTKNKVIICELKNWYREVPQEEIEDWGKNKLNVIIDYLSEQFDISCSIIEAWYILSKKQKDMDESEIEKKCKCKIKIMSKREFIENEISKIDRFLANELRPIILD